MEVSNKISKLLAIVVLALLSSQSWSQPSSNQSMGPSSSSSSSQLVFGQNNETHAYFGLQWFTGETSFTKPNIVFGLRKTKTNIENKVTGFDMSYVYSVEKANSDAFRVGYLDGNCSRGLATAGLGYSFRNDAALGFVGVVGSNGKVFGEIDGNKNLGAGVEMNTLRCAGDRKVVVP